MGFLAKVDHLFSWVWTADAPVKKNSHSVHVLSCGHCCVLNLNIGHWEENARVRNKQTPYDDVSTCNGTLVGRWTAKGTLGCLWYSACPRRRLVSVRKKVQEKKRKMWSDVSKLPHITLLESSFVWNFMLQSRWLRSSSTEAVNTQILCTFQPSCTWREIETDENRKPPSVKWQGLGEQQPLQCLKVEIFHCLQQAETTASMFVCLVEFFRIHHKQFL